MAQMHFELQVRQQLALTPRLQQSVKLLQMSTLDFNREVAEAIASNPFLEDPDDPSSSEAQASPDGSEHAGQASTGTGHDAAVDSPPSVEAPSDDPAFAQAEADAMPAPSAYSGDYPERNGSHQSDSDVGQWARSDTSMQEALRADLCSCQLSERDQYLVEYIIEAIDQDGYLRVPFAELAPAGQFSPAPGNEEWETALHLIQQLGAPGLGARDLRECMMLQLRALPDATPGRVLAMEIVSAHLDKLGRCDYAGLAQALDSTPDAIQAACALIRTLEPRPGARYSSVDPSTYIVPDVIVRKAGNQWMAVSNSAAIPQARLNDTYAKLFRGTRYHDRQLMAQALQEARWLMRSLEQRCSTIQRVAQAIVARQQTFFDYGEIALRPLMLSEIADELGIHESTVSRATSNKYLSSPRGIFEFKHFFSRELATSSGGTCSAGAVRALIQEMIDEEDPKAPLSDVTLARKLGREGIMVARRTVSKYRTQIKVPPAELRRAP